MCRLLTGTAGEPHLLPASHPPGHTAAHLPGHRRKVCVFQDRSCVFCGVSDTACATRFWTQTGISVTLAGRHGAATGTLTLPLRVWPASPTAGGPMVDSVDAPPAVVDLVTWEADLHGGVNGTAAVTSGRSLSIGASDWSSPLFGVPAQQPSAAPSASPVVAATPRRASTAAPSPLAMEAGDEDGSRHRANGHDGMLDSRGARLSLDGETDADGMTRFRDATPASPSRGPGSMRCATYAVRCGDVPLLRVCLVPQGPVVVCGTPLEGSLDFATASGGEVVALPGHHGGSPQPRSGQDALRVTAVAISLDCLESVSLEACTRGARGRVVRRVRDEMWMATGDTARCAFTFYLPPDATPTFDTGIVRLAWHLEFVFTLESHAAGQQQQLKWSLPLTVVPGGAAQAT